jgi:lipopolysaccharide export system protein LptC
MKDPRYLVREAWEYFLLYLPMACMVIVALGTYWMVRSSPAPSAPARAAVVHHTPDYFMDGFSVKTFDAFGRVRSEIVGTHARHFPDTQRLEINDIRIRSYDEKGLLTTAQADLGLTNEDGSQVQLIGNAIVVRDGAVANSATTAPRLEYRGEFLDAFMTTEQIKSNKPVELTHGSTHFTADRMDYDNVEQVLKLDGRVRGTIGANPAH